jgi:hypothetical protein
MRDFRCCLIDLLEAVKHFVGKRERGTISKEDSLSVGTPHNRVVPVLKDHRCNLNPTRLR